MKQQQQPKWQVTQQRNAGAGGILQQNSAVRTAVNDPSIYSVLPDNCKNLVEAISLKALGDWSESDYALMVGMLTVARHCK